VPTHKYFMDIAVQIALGSKCNRKKVGAVLVDSQNRIISTGYNGTPQGTPNLCENTETDTTLPYVLHAELNAILYAYRNLSDCTLYVTTAPCLHCAAIIIQSKIKHVVIKDNYRNNDGLDYLITNNIQIHYESESDIHGPG